MRQRLDELSQRLGVPETVIRSWQIGVTEMPDKDFLRLIDIITDVEPDFWGRKPKA